MKLFIYFLLFPAVLWAQPPVHVVSVNDTLPDFQLEKVLTGQEINTSSFKGKLLLIDIMATDCSNCIAALPRLDSLQNYFKDSMQIILVTSEKKTKVANFFSNNKIGQQVKLPVVYEDKWLHQSFPHEAISHVVWVDAWGVVRAITGSGSIVREKIREMLSGRAIHWRVKNDFLKMDRSIPLFNLNSSVPYYNIPSGFNYSAFTTYMTGVGSGNFRKTDTVTGITKISMLNLSIIDMYRMVQHISRINDSTVCVEAVDKTKWLRSDIQDLSSWTASHCFCYETLLPVMMPEEKKKEKILHDLDVQFGITVLVDRKAGITTLTIIENGNPCSFYPNKNLDE
jgi:thiol-disulfide isomerase/thioredoxin